MSWIAPTVTEFKGKFLRDFQYAPAEDPTNLKYVTDGDIQAAIDDGNIDFNSGLFGDAATAIFLYLAAYHLVQNIQMGSKGLTAQAIFTQASKSVGGVSVSNQIASQYADDPITSKYLKNAYGQKYIELAHPYLIGGVLAVMGRTTNA